MKQLAKAKKHTYSKAIYFFLVFMLVFSCLPLNSVNAESNISVMLKGTVDYDMSYAVLDQVNKEREKAGVGALEMDYKAMNAANIRARECILRYSHKRTVNEKWTALIPSGWTESGENLGIGYNNAKSVVDAWMDSPAHRTNMLNPNYKIIGIGVFRYKDPFTGGVLYSYAQHFSNGPLNLDSKSGQVAGVYEVIADLEYYPLDFELLLNGEKNTTQVAINFKGKLKPRVLISGEKIWDKDYIVAEPSTLEWEISDPTVAEITEDGLIKGIRIGETNIRAYSPAHEYETEFNLIVRRPISLAEVTQVNPQEYTGNDIRPKIQVKYGKSELVEGVDYEIRYSDNLYVGTSHIHVIGKGEYGGEKVIHFEIFDDSTTVEETLWQKFLALIGLR